MTKITDAIHRSTPRRRAGAQAEGSQVPGPRPSAPETHRRGQSLVELALILPLLVVVLSIVIEAGLALNAWIRVNTAARDATRFVLDAGRPGDTVLLVREKLKGIDFGSSREMTSSTHVDIYMIKGTTNASGFIPTGSQYWKVDHIYDPDARGGTPRITRSAVEARIRQLGNPNSIPFAIVEVDFQYTPLLATLLARGATLPMTSYAIMQQYSQ